MTVIVAGLLLGLASSLHCAAMCGPIALLAAGGRWKHAALHHSGRALAYATLGIVSGSAGHLVAGAGYRSAIAIAAGAVLVAAAAFAFVNRTIAPAERITRKMTSFLGATLRRLDVRAWHGRLTAGALNALVPCGLLYAALGAAAGLGAAVDGGVFMLAFGAGTAPALIALSLAPIPARARTRLRYAPPIAAALVGLLLIGRGIGISPFGSHTGTHAPNAAGTVHTHDAH